MQKQVISLWSNEMRTPQITAVLNVMALRPFAGSKGKEPFYPGGYQKQKAGVTGLKFFLNLLGP